MEENKLISLTHLCGHYKIEVSFIHDLDQYGLLRIIRDHEEEFLDTECLSQLETLMRLHYDLNINMEGLDAISHMLERMKEMQKELTALRNRLAH